MPQKKAPAVPEAVDVYRTSIPGVVIRRYGNNDESPLLKGTIIDPASVDDLADLERLVANGFIRKITIRTHHAAPTVDH